MCGELIQVTDCLLYAVLVAGGLMGYALGIVTMLPLKGSANE